MCFFRESHMKHHQYTVHHYLDMEVELPLTVKWYHWLMWFTFYLRKLYLNIKTTINRSFGRLSSEWEQRLFYKLGTKYKQLIRWNRWLIVFQLTVIGRSILSGQYYIIMYIIITPYVFQFMNIFIGLTQHIGMTSNSDDFRESCRTVKLDPLFEFLYWKMNYHVEHHMFAGVPFYNLGILRRQIIQDLPVAKGLLLSWADIKRINSEEKSMMKMSKDGIEVIES